MLLSGHQTVPDARFGGDVVYHLWLSLTADDHVPHRTAREEHSACMGSLQRTGRVSRSSSFESASGVRPAAERRSVMPLKHRPIVVICLGAIIALVGISFFLGAHALTMPPRGQTYNLTDVELHEALWCAFGIGLMFCGAVIGAAGLFAWCRSGA